MDKQQADTVIVIACAVAGAAALAGVVYAIWANERQHRETRDLLDGLDELRAQWRQVPRSVFDPAEQL